MSYLFFVSDFPQDLNIFQIYRTVRSLKQFPFLFFSPLQVFQLYLTVLHLKLSGCLPGLLLLLSLQVAPLQCQSIASPLSNCHWQILTLSPANTNTADDKYLDCHQHQRWSSKRLGNVFLVETHTSDTWSVSNLSVATVKQLVSGDRVTLSATLALADTFHSNCGSQGVF